MTRLDCCRLRQASLNELPNCRVVNRPEELLPGAALISDVTPTSSRSAHDLQPIREIFAFSLDDDRDSWEHQRFLSDQDFGPKRAMLFKTRRKEGNRKLHEIARILRSRISGETEVSKRSSKKKKTGSSDAGEEDIERRKELKRALHRRLEEELLQDKKDSEEGYDADAIPIKTPNGTWGRTSGSSPYDPGRLRPEVGRFESPSPSLGRGLHKRHYPSKHGGHRQISTDTKDHYPEQWDQIFGLQRTSSSRLAEDKHIPTTRKNLPQITAPRQYNSARPRFEQSDLNTYQSEREGALGVQNVRKLHSSRSANFFNFGSHKDRNHATMATRRLSMQNIRNYDGADSASITPDVDDLAERPKWIRGPLRFLAPYAGSLHEVRRDPDLEQIGVTGFDGVGDSDKYRFNPMVTRKVVPQRSVSFSLDPIRTAPDASSKSLVPSKSLSQLDMHAQRQKITSDSDSPLLHHVKTHQERRNSSSGITHLKVPDALPYGQRNVASSNYSSYNDSLASSRRSSLMKLQSLSERLDSIKNDPKGKNSSSAWSSALDIPRVPSSQFTTDEIDDARRRTLEAERLHARATQTTTGRSRSPSPPHGVVDLQNEPFYEDEIRPNRDFGRRRGYALKRGSSERRSSSNLDGSDEWYHASRRKGYGCDFVTPVYEDASFVWGKAFQDHADKDSVHPKTRLGNVSPAHSRQSLESRVQGSRTRITRPRLQRGVQYSSSEFWKERLQPSYRIDLDQPNPIDASKPGNRIGLKSSSPLPAASWSRFPSHTRAERSFSPAGKADKVTARDFAVEFESMEAPVGQRASRLFPFGNKKKNRSMPYGKSVMSTWNRIYSVDLRRLNRGHRSSIALGGRVEYPELEILPHLSPPVQPLDEMSKRDTAMVLKALRSNSSQQSIVPTPNPDNETAISASTWSKMYEDCLHHPVDIDESLVNDTSSVLSQPRPTLDSSVEEENDQFSPRSSAEMRTSTLNFQKLLQDGESKAQQRALQAADDAWGSRRRLSGPVKRGAGSPKGDNQLLKVP